jgi:hypothetical protein
MSVLGASAAALAWLGRQRTRAIAAVVFVGIALPPLDALLKPFVTEAAPDLSLAAAARPAGAAVAACRRQAELKPTSSIEEPVAGGRMSCLPTRVMTSCGADSAGEPWRGCHNLPSSTSDGCRRDSRQ